MTSEDKVHLERDLFGELVRQTNAGWPDEVCGVLLGNAATRHVTALRPVRNAHAEPRRRYRIDPVELVAVLDEADRSGHEVVGFYHSHPRGWDRPSQTDAAEATWVDAVYMILSLDPVRLGAWVWRGGDDVNGFEELPVRLVQDGQGA